MFLRGRNEGSLKGQCQLLAGTVVEELFVVLWYLANFYKCVFTYFFQRTESRLLSIILELLFTGLIPNFYITMFQIL